MAKLKSILGSLAVIAVGLLIVTVPFWMLDDENDPYNEYRLIRYGRTTTARVIRAWQEVEEWDDGHSAGWVSYCVYRFSLPNGKSLTHKLRGEDTSVGETLKIEYLPSNPQISRIKGSGNSSIGEWLLRLPVFLLLVAISTAAGGSITWHGLKEMAKDVRGKT